MSHYRCTTFYIVIDDDMVEDVFGNILTRVGKSCGLRGIARQLHHRGDVYYVLVEGYDYQVADYIKFLRTGYAAIGDISRVKHREVRSVSDFRLADRFWFVKADLTQIPESSDDELDGPGKLAAYLEKTKKRRLT